LAGVVDVVHLIGEVPEVATTVVAFLAPIVGELNLSAFVAGHTKKDEREAAGFVLHAPPLLEPEELEKCNSGVRIGHADHAVQEFHFASLNSSL